MFKQGRNEAINNENYVANLKPAALVLGLKMRVNLMILMWKARNAFMHLSGAFPLTLGASLSGYSSPPGRALYARRKIAPTRTSLALSQSQGWLLLPPLSSSLWGWGAAYHLLEALSGKWWTWGHLSSAWDSRESPTRHAETEAISLRIPFPSHSISEKRKCYFF